MQRIDSTFYRIHVSGSEGRATLIAGTYRISMDHRTRSCTFYQLITVYDDKALADSIGTNSFTLQQELRILWTATRLIPDHALEESWIEDQMKSVYLASTVILEKMDIAE